MENLNNEWLEFLALSFLVMSTVGGLLAVAISALERISSFTGSRIKKDFTLSARPFDMARKAVLLLLLIPFWIIILFFAPAHEPQGVRISPSALPDTSYSAPASESPITSLKADGEKDVIAPVISARQFKSALLLIWVGGALFLLIKTTANGGAFYIRLKKMKKRGIIRHLNDEKAQALLTRCCERLRLKNPPVLYSCSMLSTPILTHLDGQAVIIPDTLAYNLSESVLLHELNHLKSKDLAYKLFLRLACCIHWFNPAVWSLSYEAQKSCELSCDERTCSLLDSTGKREYAQAIFNSITPSKQYAKQALCLGGDKSSKRDIKKRLQIIMKASLSKKSAIALGAILVTSLLIGGSAICLAAAPTPPDITVTAENGSNSTLSSTTDLNKADKEPSLSLSSIVLDNDGNTNRHEIPPNGEAVYYSKTDTGFSLVSGESIVLRLKLTDRNFPDGQGVEIGYIHGESRAPIFNGQVKGEAVTEFSPILDGEYLFYVKCRSSDSLLAEGFSISRSTLTQLPLYGKTIVLDPGHGGDDNGTMVAGEDNLEKTYNLLQAQELAQAFIASGAEVTMTRNDDTAVSYDDRVQIAKDINPDLFLSIHHASASVNTKPNGLSLSTDFIKGCADNEKFLDVLNTELLPLFRSETKIINREKTFIVVRETEYPAVYMELGFMSNPEDLAQIQNPEHRKAVCDAIVRASIRLMTEQVPEI